MYGSELATGLGTLVNYGTETRTRSVNGSSIAGRAAAYNEKLYLFHILICRTLCGVSSCR